MNDIRIYDTDDHEEIAKKIFEDFDVLQSCKVVGFYEGMNTDTGRRFIVPKGDLVLDHIKLLDSQINIYDSKTDKRGRRIHRKLPNTIGGYVAHKIFKYDVKMTDREPVFTIWRIQ